MPVLSTKCEIFFDALQGFHQLIVDPLQVVAAEPDRAVGRDHGLDNPASETSGYGLGDQRMLSGSPRTPIRHLLKPTATSGLPSLPWPSRRRGHATTRLRSRTAGLSPLSSARTRKFPSP